MHTKKTNEISATPLISLSLIFGESMCDAPAFFFSSKRGLCNSSFQPQTECCPGDVIFDSKGPSMLEVGKMFKGKLWSSSYILRLLSQKI